MRIVIQPDAAAVATFAAMEIANQVKSKPSSCLGLATGGTPVGAYRELIRLYKSIPISFANVNTFNLDEYVGLAAEHPCSYRRFMNENLFQHIDIPLEQTFVPIGDAGSLHGECLAYEERIRSLGGIDLQLLGIGSDGHIAFNEPGSSLASRTRVKTLTQLTRTDNARFFDSIEQVPKSAITMGIGTILESRSILLIACGAGKADAIAAAVEGPLSAALPASSLQLHPCVTLVVDQAAAAGMKRADYYRMSEAERARLEQL
ncbi:MAG: glucosamine-6-phosphate deaminase [Planctomycetota bacterium]|nr:glucosamine-6-phosphate deaminase [Planctomycetota bacterium]